ncbi:MAG: TetR/AcrR family transcriptional regulator [Candidatus Zixiibacteriota bacterium]|nr:MAG: TetR/AcrR family transcriptional regulator [candidate division Zixibacteria bacterium]
MARTTDKEAKRKQIIEAALKVFARKGLSNFKMAEIAEEAVVGKGTLYEYFRTKEELIMGSISQFMMEFEEYVMAQIVAVDGPVEKIERIVQASCEYCLKNEEQLDAMLDFYAVGIPRSGGGPALMDLAPRYRSVIQWVGDVIQEGIDKGLFRKVDPESVASIVVAVLDGFIFQAAIGVLKMDPQKLSASLRDTIVNGLLKETEQGRI